MREQAGFNRNLTKNRTASHSQFNLGVIGMIALGGALPVVGTIVSYLFLPDWRWPNIPVHSVDEAVGAFAALTLAMMLFMQHRAEQGTGYRVWMACGFTGMGILALTHALPQPGPAFVWLYSTSNLIGGVFFAMVWLPDRVDRSGRGMGAPWIVAVGAVIFGALSLAYPDAIPTMVKEGAFTSTAKAINIVGGLLFLAATIHLVLRYRAKGDFDDLLFANISLLLGVAGVIFDFSRLWDASWWFWHLLRLIAFLIALGYLFVVFRRTGAKQDLLVEYLNKVPTPLSVIDREFTIQFISEIGARFAGTSVDAATGRKCYTVFRTEHCQTPECRLGQAMEKDGFFTGQTTALGADAVPIQYTGAPLKDGAGNIVGALDFVTDISDLKRAQQVLEDAMTEYMVFAEKVGAGDLSIRLEVDAGDVIGRLGVALNRMVEKLTELAVQSRDATGEITSMTAEILATTSQQAATVTQQAAAVTETSSTVQEVRQTAEQSHERIRIVSEIVQESTGVVEQGLQAVQETVKGMDSVKEQVGNIAETILALSEQTQQIGEIISSVNDIADQSNLLALNAAIEAARAGEAGKGFAVVAGEVRTLAEQSRQATAQVRDILGEIQKATNTAVMVTEEGTKRAEAGQELARTTGEAFRAINERIRKVVEAAQQIAASAKQQLAGVDQVGSAMESIDQAAAQTEAGTKQTEKAVHGLNALAEQLRGIVEQYKLN
ncbi:MAG: PAS domain-containing protein [Desulfobacteraceae bacterium]|uniref:PAS domain-containing protein n=1 Tax=Candidatus Desulfacyla euxinica TaxID=2841693 RepID=A0A8J6N4X2_9DELT|nr:PAS domain-containing protein [Candidatus Desulfacyla euxinica]MBL6977620.1 PAS domain-containing protein [Desulfobacteraceae bacterium]MBL7216207.1 PAS domain-containing protein [Desulfobacteraceae bacterium]